MPFGYRRTSTRSLEPDPDDAPGLRLAFEQYATGRFTDGEIADLLNRKGYRTLNKRGRRPFGKDTVRAMLSNPFYTGVVSYKGDPIQGKHEALVGSDLFEKCQHVRSRRYVRRIGGVNRATKIYPASGLLVCEECGKHYRGMPARGQRWYYDPGRSEYRLACQQPKTIPAQPIEDDLADILSAIRLPAKWRDRVLKNVKRDAPKSSESDRVRLTTQLERAKQLFLMGDYSEAEYRADKVRIEAQLAETRPVEQLDVLRAGELLADFPHLWGLANDEERKRLLQSALQNAYVKQGAVIAIQPRRAIYDLLKSTMGAGDKLQRPSELRVRTRRGSNRAETTALPKLIPPATPVARLPAFV